jgi:hypothetical protein
VAVTVIGAEAVAHLHALVGESEHIRVAVLRDLAEEAVKRIRDLWPVATGLSRAGWYALAEEAGAVIGNGVDYTSFVWSERVDDYWLRVIERVLDDLLEEWEAATSARVLALLDRGDRP